MFSVQSSNSTTSSYSFAMGFIIYLSRVDWDFRDIFLDVSKKKTKKGKQQAENVELNSKHAIGARPICTTPRSDLQSVYKFSGEP